MFQIGARDASLPQRPLRIPDSAGALGFPMLAVLLFAFATRHGIGILPDSTRYMDLSPKPWDAPLYPALLHLIAATGVDIATGAWALGLVLAALNAFLTWHLLRLATGKLAYAAVGTALIVIAPQTAALHALAMSEPLFLTAILGTVFAMMHACRTGNRRWLIGVGIGIGLASLVRFTGPALGVAVALFLLIDPRRGWAGRVIDILTIMLPSALLFLGWAAVSKMVNGRSTGRALEWFGNMTGADWLASYQALVQWIVPDAVPLAIGGILFLCVLGASIALLLAQGQQCLARAEAGRADFAMVAIPLGLFFFTYLGFMVLATSLEANLHLNGRYAYPIYCTSLLAVTIALATWRDGSVTARRLHMAFVILACLMLVGHAARTTARTHEAYRQGIGFDSLAWEHSPTLAAVRRLPPSATLYSNGPDAIGYLLRRPARSLPVHVQPRTGRDDPAFPFVAQAAAARATLARGNAYVVFLDGVDWRFYMATENELVRRLDLIPVARFTDGAIYRSREVNHGD